MSFQAKQYAHALFGLLQTKDNLEFAIATFKSFRRAYEMDHAIRFFFDHPNIATADKELVLTRLFESAIDAKQPCAQHVLHTLLLMTRNNDLYKLSKLVYLLKKIGDSHFDILEVRVTSAAPLTDSLRQLITQRFSEHDGQTVILREKLDESLIGGLRIRVHDELIDASILGKLQTFINS